MYQEHFNSIASTQIYLKNKLEELWQKGDKDILISCSEQTEGVGRTGNRWESFPNSLAISFTLRPNSTPSLTPLEIGLITIKFLKRKLGKDLFIKWPNDILTTEGKKCGGIICQYIDSKTVVAGLGINLGRFDVPKRPDFRHGLGIVDSGLDSKDFDQKTFSKELYNELLNGRINDRDRLKKEFGDHCAHLNKNVIIFEDGKDHIGVFKGIGDNGEALVSIDSKIKPFISSSLTILD